MFARVYSEISKINGVIETQSGKEIFLLATFFKVILNENTWGRINNLPECKELKQIIKYASLFIANVIHCSEDDFFEFWGETDTTLDIYDAIERHRVKDEEVYDVTLKLQLLMAKFLVKGN